MLLVTLHPQNVAVSEAKGPHAIDRRAQALKGAVGLPERKPVRAPGNDGARLIHLVTGMKSSSSGRSHARTRSF